MKSLWIRVEAHEVDSLRVDALAQRLDIPDAYALGLYVALGGAVAEHSPTGSIAQVSDRKLEEWARWRGKRGAFAAAAREILQDAAGELAEWRESMGKLLEQREKDRARKIHGTSEEIPRNGHGNSVVTERNGTERNVSASTSPPHNSNKRSGDLRAREESPAAAAPLADARAPELPREAEELLAVSYPDPAVRERKRRELQRTLTSGAKYRGHLVLAQSARRLAAKCQELLDNPPRDASKAVAVLLVKLSDMSDGSAPGAVAAAEEQQDAQRTEGEIARELIDANAWIEDHPEHERKIANTLEHNGFGRPDPGEDEMLTRARGIARNELVRRAYRQRRAEHAHAG